MMARKVLALIAIGVAVLVALPTNAWADGIDPDPPLIRFGACQPNCDHLLPSDQVVAVPANGITVYYQSQGQGNSTLTNPILIIIGIPNDTSGTAAPAITSVSLGSGMLGGANTYAGTWNTSTGYAGSFTSGVVYDLVGVDPAGSSSQNYGNWDAGVEFVTGMTVNGFGIYVYTLTGQSFDPGDSFMINFASDLPIGTMLVGYGCDATTTNSAGVTVCDGVGNTFSTPFTESGMVVPEPGTLALFGTGLIGLAGAIRRRLSK